MVNLKNKQGQAAIEFLMTYGWMLLVVLIVGALIFSFVDFGSLLPNKVDLSNTLKAEPTESVASASKKEVAIVFSYNGAKAAGINISEAILKTELGENCSPYYLENLDLSKNVILNYSGNTFQNKYGSFSYAPGSELKETLTYLNGHDGVIKFDCSGLSNKMIENDVITGRITIQVKNVKTGLSVPSTGTFRLTITN